jgi:hypothetical protein
MVANGEWPTPTRASGMAAYGVAVTSCGIVSVAGQKRMERPKIAAWLTAIESVLMLGMIVDGRWVLHQLFVNIAQNQLDYGLRRLPQIILVPFSWRYFLLVCTSLYNYSERRSERSWPSWEPYYNLIT